jgi:ABC-type polysaccharide/polyol phosphate export permease
MSGGRFRWRRYAPFMTDTSLARQIVPEDPGAPSGASPVVAPVEAYAPEPRSVGAIADMWRGACNVRAWSMLAWDDIRSRYRRTKLGPFWLTLSHAAMIGGVALAFSVIFNQKLDEYFVYLAAGMTIWAMIAATLIDAPGAFIRGQTLLLAYDLPASIHIFRSVLTQLIVFGHHLVIYIFALVFVKNMANWYTLLAIPGLVLVALAAIGYGAILSFLGARYRDLGPAIAALISLLYMFTPIFWQRELLREHAWVADLNPLLHLIEVVRAPMLGKAPSLLNYCVAGGIAATALILGGIVYARARRQLTYWL